MMASGMPSGDSCRYPGPATSVAFGEGDAVDLDGRGIDVGDTGMKLGVVVVDPKTKICRLAGVVALMLNGANAVPTPICRVIPELAVGIGTVIRPPSTIWAPPAELRMAVSVTL